MGDKYKNIIDEFADSCPCKDVYCSLRELITYIIKDPKTFVQIKCVEKYKYEKSKELGHDIGWSGAWEEWVEKGLAKRFSEVYDEGKSIFAIYKECVKGKDC